ncbi:hypothetical protein HNR42_001308 [Deinobacterium chartae]|uniref:Carboxypeptidase regulatory-like domain-containing protein n=1 Tax=Deinobacterium chartae TaxID=521158 RepID=A0A841I1R3_9DEIO|nr:carboxypeptidase-like regulatory domain-containing protein [Deinobacterium chartae]MBB6097885.1 hypothetical protein [Deinobacterium chartae]
MAVTHPRFGRSLRVILAFGALCAPGIQAQGSVQGQVVDGHGKPLAGARLEVYEVYSRSRRSFVLRSDQNGRYRAKLPPQQTAPDWGQPTDAFWKVSAHLEIARWGHRYCFPLLAAHNRPLRSQERAVRDFRLFQEPRGLIRFRLRTEQLPPLNRYTLELTLVPTGPLWDGSRLSPQVIRTHSRELRPGLAIFDAWYVPLGQYDISVALIGTANRARPLKVAPLLKRAGGNPWRAKTGRYGASVRTDFIPSSSCRYAPTYDFDARAG